jgi:septum formation protein
MKRLVLASSSPRRRELLKRTGIQFIIEQSKYEEKINHNVEPKELVKSLSLGKAKSVAKSHKNAIVLAADTVIVLEGEIIGKPKNEEDAKRTLAKMSGKPHFAITGFAIIDTGTNKTVSKSVETKVYFRKLTPKEIDDYVKSKEPLDKAGSYAIQGLASKFVDEVEGDFDNVVGLPVSDLIRELREFGIYTLN